MSMAWPWYLPACDISGIDGTAATLGARDYSIP
jgi:hypothetical protein